MRLPRSERGIALVVALLVLLVLSMLAIVLMTAVTVETKLTGHSTREASALNVAEAGVAEALSQVRAGNVDVRSTNPRAVWQIFNTTPGSVPVLGADSTGLPTLQPAGQWLNYSSSKRSANALTVRFRTDGARTVIYRFDRTANPHIQTATGFPIFQVVSTGQAGPDTRQILGEFIQKPVDVLAKGAVVANVGIDFKGNIEVCGKNHSMNTPPGTRGAACNPYELGYGDLPGAWSSGGITENGSPHVVGSPDTVQYRTGFYDGPWSVFNMTQSQFYSWTGPAQWPPPTPPVGIVRIDNNTTPQDKSASVNFPGGSGQGLLYVDGDLTVNGTFDYKGLVYIEGNLQINGSAWILGGLIVKGVTNVKLANGDCTVLYSADAIQQMISQYGGQFVNISWREL